MYLDFGSRLLTRSLIGGNIRLNENKIIKRLLAAFTNFEQISTRCSCVCTVDFKQINIGWISPETKNKKVLICEVLSLHDQRHNINFLK